MASAFISNIIHHSLPKFVRMHIYGIFQNPYEVHKPPDLIQNMRMVVAEVKSDCIA